MTWGYVRCRAWRDVEAQAASSESRSEPPQLVASTRSRATNMGTEAGSPWRMSTPVRRSAGDAGRRLQQGRIWPQGGRLGRGDPVAVAGAVRSGWQRGTPARDRLRRRDQSATWACHRRGVERRPRRRSRKTVGGLSAGNSCSTTSSASRRSTTSSGSRSPRTANCPRSLSSTPSTASRSTPSLYRAIKTLWRKKATSGSPRSAHKVLAKYSRQGHQPLQCGCLAEDGQRQGATEVVVDVPTHPQRPSARGGPGLA